MGVLVCFFILGNAGFISSTGAFGFQIGFMLQGCQRLVVWGSGTVWGLG